MAAAFVHGACLVFVDAIGLHVASARTERAARRCRCLKQLRSLLPGGVEPKAVHAGAEGVPIFDDATASAGGAQPGRRYGLHLSLIHI